MASNSGGSGAIKSALAGILGMLCITTPPKGFGPKRALCPPNRLRVPWSHDAQCWRANHPVLDSNAHGGSCAEHPQAGIIPTGMKNIVILISGKGSNMAAIVNTARRDGWHDKLGARVAAVISNKAEAKGLVWAREQGIATEVLDHETFGTREAFDAALAH